MLILSIFVISTSSMTAIDSMAYKFLVTELVEDTALAEHKQSLNVTTVCFIGLFLKSGYSVKFL